MRLAHFQFDPETDRLGEGPLSEVYKAVDLQLGRTVALKVLRPHAEIDPQADTRFHREARHTSALEHPNITTIYEYGHDQGTSFIAMEYLRGRTLDKIIKDQSLGYEECLRIALQLTSALAVVHKHNLIHRDLKPANTLLQDDGTLKLLDFGIARARDEAGITQHGMLVGTVLYMSPEQVRGDELDFRSDIFSLGAVLYHVWTGQLPFPGGSFPEVCMAILDGQPARRPSQVRKGFPKELENFLLGCMQSDPNERFADATLAHGELVAIADQLSATGAPSTSLRGTLLLPEVQCGGELTEACHVMAGGLRQDLASELSRTKGLTVRLEQREASFDHDFVLDCELTVDGHVGTLALTLEFFEHADAPLTRTRRVLDGCEHEETDDMVLQQDLATSAARIVRRRLSEGARTPVARVDRRVKEALAMCERSREMLRRGTTKHLLSAATGFRRALDLDRYCAEAYAGMAESLVRKYLYWDGDTVFLDEAREHAARALRNDPTCALAHTALGFGNHLSGHADDAQREYRLAIQLDKDEWYAHRLLGGVYAREGNFKHAAPMLRRSIGLRPQNIGAYDHLFMVLQRLDRYEEALEVADDGIAASTEHLKQVPDDMDARLHMALLQARLDRDDKARAAIAAAQRIAPKDGYVAFHAASVFALLGEVEEAMKNLRLAQHRGYYVKSEMVGNTDLDVLRGLAEFIEMTS
jgi:Flp pilus assembly protein TadD/predicted Ser/Thr protein kinase